MASRLELIQDHCKYLLKELNFGTRRDKISESKFYNYFSAIIKKFTEITNIPKNSLDIETLFQILVPKHSYMSIPINLLINTIAKIEMEYWAIIRYCEGKNKDIQEIEYYKNFLISLAGKLDKELNSNHITPEGRKFLKAIRGWNLASVIQGSPFELFTNIRIEIPPFGEISLLINQLYREIDYCFSVISTFAFSLFNNQELSQNTRDKLVKTHIFNIIRCLDQFFLYNSTPRAKELFGRRKITEIMRIIKMNSISSILDLFANSGLLGIISFLYGKNHIHINDTSFHLENSVLNEFLQGIQDLIDNNKLNNEEEFENILRKFKNDQILSLKPLIPSTATFVNPINLWNLTGPPLHILEEYIKRLTITKVQIDNTTQSGEISGKKFDLIVIDPPFGVVSNYQVTEDQGKDLLHYSVKLADTLLNNSSWIIIRARENWGEPRTPSNWKLKRTISGKAKMYVYNKKTSRSNH